MAWFRDLLRQDSFAAEKRYMKLKTRLDITTKKKVFGQTENTDQKTVGLLSEYFSSLEFFSSLL